MYILNIECYALHVILPNECNMCVMFIKTCKILSSYKVYTNFRKSHFKDSYKLHQMH